jgi:dipeptidyl aminopeptidase/acylaminoacyl peptidase
MSTRRHEFLRVAALLLVASLIAAPGEALRQYSRTSDVIYGRKMGLALTMEVFTPAKRSGLGVVWVVSSSGRSSVEQTREPSFERRILPLLQHGYVVFAVIHGSSPAFQIPDYIDDARRAVRVVRHRAREFGIDGERLGIAGSSSGGTIALMVAMQSDHGDAAAKDPVDRTSSRVQAVGCFFPPTDFLNYGETSVTLFDLWRQRGISDPAFQFYDSDPKTGARTLTTDRVRIQERLRDISPVSHVTAEDPPALLIHGDADKAVPLQQSRRLLERLKETNVPARLVVREGMGHAWPGWEADSESIAQWFDTHLRR